METNNSNQNQSEQELVLANLIHFFENDTSYESMTEDLAKGSIRLLNALGHNDIEASAIYHISNYLYYSSRILEIIKPLAKHSKADK